jgi:hypothetical protein
VGVRGSTLLLGLAALSVLAALPGCGGGSGGESTSQGKVDVVFSGDQDRKIGADLRTYLGRNIPTPSELQQVTQACAVTQTNAGRRGCEMIRQGLDAVAKLTVIEVKDGVITLHTDLQGDDTGHAEARFLCDLIQGSDVADFTPGHTVRGRDDQELLTCPARQA